MDRVGRTRALLIPGLIVIVVTVVTSIVVAQAISPTIGLAVVGTGLVSIVWITMVSPGGLLARERRATAALAESERRYRTLVETAQDLIWSVDASGEWTFVNEASRRIYGIEPTALVGQTMMERAEDGQGSDDAQMLISAMRGHPCIGMIRRHRREDGSIVELSFNAAALRDADGTVIGATGTANDLTERLRAERELERSEAQLRIVTDALPVLISYVDADLKVLFLNREHDEWLKRSSRDLLSRSLKELLSDQDLKALDPWLQAVLKGERCSFERQITHPSLGPRKVRIDLEPHVVSQPWAEPVTAGFVTLITDETDRLRLESELRHAQMMEAVGQLASGIAHDFNNLLSAMFSQLAVARARTTGIIGASQILEELELTAQQARGITKFLLSLGHKGSADRSPTDLVALVSQAGHMINRMLPASISIELSIPSDQRIWVLADRIQLQQTLLNLAINARDAMPSGGTLRIALESHDGPTPGKAQAIIRVTDTGQGMPQEVLARIFEPFFTTKPKDRGTGLGLAMIKRIVEDHDGTIVASSKQGEGATFVVTLPIAPSTNEESTPSTSAPSADGILPRVVLAGPNRHIREILATSLRAASLDITTCADEKELIECVRQQSSGVQGIVLDLGGHHGAEVARKLASTGSPIPILLITDLDIANLDDLSPGELITPFRKPFALPALTSAVRDMLSRRAQTTPEPPEPEDGTHP
jgi:PAS domain S-box-containing protein